MQCELQSRKDGKANLYIEGQEPAMGIDYPEAIRRIDLAYTAEYADLAEQIENHIAAARAAIAQLLRIVDNLEKVLHTIKTRHLGQTE